MITEEIQTLEDFKHKILNEPKITLYHGSRDGIDGRIKPINHKRRNGECVFGTGFYKSALG
ncbi:MAG: hypothetical protein IKM88_04235 [Lachnospiraceae bacterium]|nr:hypothetical protein [Lachnospiraceae bacterium]MBR6849427.1 hypothetical protein [Lachnospiraceae bacterium]